MRLLLRLPRRGFLRLAVGIAAFPYLPDAVMAQSYPARPVRVIVPYSPGGPTDVCARLIAQALSDRLGKQFYVENITGAGGNIGSGQAARAAPDGYTILITVNSLVINPTLYDKVPYDMRKDFEAVTLVAIFQSAMLVNPSVPATTVNELVALVKANPAKYSFASPGFGTPSHLLGEQFRVAAGLDLVHVPYGGSGQVIASVLAGNTPIGFAALSAAVPQLQDGKLRALAVMSKFRSPAVPELPTIAEAGYPELDGDAWVGVLVPAGTAKEAVNLLHREIVEIIALPEVKERLAAIGLQPVGDSAEEFSARMKLEMEKWAKVIEAAKIKAR
jgi:tripartite-type tricarboxylate transporter receptor subunit TctC